jgi:hypothetical protein
LILDVKYERREKKHGESKGTEVNFKKYTEKENRAVFLNVLWRKIDYKTGLDFLSSADSCHVYCVLEISIGVSFRRTQHMTILNSSILSHEINASKNEFHRGIDFSQRINSVERMPGVLKSSKIHAYEGFQRKEREG